MDSRELEIEAEKLRALSRALFSAAIHAGPQGPVRSLRSQVERRLAVLCEHRPEPVAAGACAYASQALYLHQRAEEARGELAALVNQAADYLDRDIVRMLDAIPKEVCDADT